MLCDVCLIMVVFSPVLNQSPMSFSSSYPEYLIERFKQDVTVATVMQV
jgi:hypothetical protein